MKMNPLYANTEKCSLPRLFAKSLALFGGFGDAGDRFARIPKKKRFSPLPAALFFAAGRGWGGFFCPAQGGSPTLRNTLRSFHPTFDVLLPAAAEHITITPMPKLLHLIEKGATVLRRRLQTQGLFTTLLWAYGRGMPFLTGVPLLRFGMVTPQLYVGSQFNARGKRVLEQQGFNACVNMRIEKDDAAYGLALARYLHLPTIDDAAPTLEHLDQGVAFIREVIDQQGKVYIHCGAGVGRAPTMAAAYLIAEGRSLEEALSMIRAARPFITITPPQMTRLQEWERRARDGQAPSTIEQPTLPASSQPLAPAPSGLASPPPQEQ